MNKYDEIYMFLEDWDNSELEGDDWTDQMEIGILEYYDKHPNCYMMKLKNRIANYLSWKREKVYGDR